MNIFLFPRRRTCRVQTTHGINTRVLWKTPSKTKGTSRYIYTVLLCWLLPNNRVDPILRKRHFFRQSFPRLSKIFNPSVIFWETSSSSIGLNFKIDRIRWNNNFINFEIIGVILWVVIEKNLFIYLPWDIFLQVRFKASSKDALMHYVNLLLFESFKYSTNIIS